MSLRSEIAEQPRVIRRLLREGLEDARRAGGAVAAAEHVTIAARGSSDNAATFGKYLFEGLAGIVTALAAPSLATRYASAPDFARGAVIGISQSGAAPDVAEVLAAARRAGAATIAITNTPRSRVARTAELVVPLRAGPERSIAATKTYTATCAALALIASACAEARGRSGLVMTGFAEAIDAAVSAGPDAKRLARSLGRARSLIVVGRGFAYPSALEAALKVKELARVWAEPYSSADLAHGPIALVARGTPVLLLSACGALDRETRALTTRLLARGARVYAITNDERVAGTAQGAVLLRTDAHEALAAIALVVVAQQVAGELARRHGLDPDRPAGLAKVTRTR